ncbi:MAG: SpoIIE family protein phosphatase, partial [Bacteroidales bacterium]|nr:SpoIIE family protein phosphatase [Bacteroidales bacterium]
SIAILCPMSEVYAKANTARRTLYLIGFIGLIIIVLVIFFVVKKMTQPFKVFSESAKEIAHGNFETPLPEITSQDEMLDMRNSFEYMQKELQDYIKDLQTTTQAKEKIENELHIAHEIQMSMIPKIFPPFPKRKDIDLYATLTPAKEVGGDLYDFFLKDNKLFFAIGDVSGKGVPASLVMAITKSLVHTLAFQTNSLKNLIEAVNNAISENNSANMFVTFFIGILNLEDGHVSYCNAGHNPPLLISPTGKVSPINVTPNIPLGLFEGFEYVEESIDIKKGSKILLFTDGVTEAENKAKELYDDKRLQGCTITHAHLSAKGLIESIMDDVKDHVKDAPQSDDLTMLVLHYCQED